ncbi:MAG: beta-carotene 3-hydroxylase [Acidimicrobiaceae bacterium]
MPPVVLVLAAFVLMEPVAYLTHRFVMHGRLGSWHRSHHQVRVRPLETNDLYPLVGAAISIVIIALGTAVDSLIDLAWVGAGITLYGAGYLFVHDLYIHRRIPSFTWQWAPLERVREAHRIHHLWAGEPFGFLFPVVPGDLRTRARAVTRDPLRDYDGLLPGGH